MQERKSVFVALAAGALAACSSNPEATPAPPGLSFDSDPVGATPASLDVQLSGKGAPPRFVVREDATAPSGGRVLVQEDADDTEKRFPVALVRGVASKDVRVSVRAKAISGRVDQAFGLVARYVGPGDYYITRANALEGNVRLYHFVDGIRTQLASFDGPIAAGVWHELALEVVGTHLRVVWNGATVIELDDATISAAGAAGVWTKADSVTAFDDLLVSPR